MSPDGEPTTLLTLLKTLVEGLQKENADLRQAMADERDIRILHRERFLDQILPKLLSLAPVFLSRLMNKDAPAGDGASALALVAKELVKTLSDEQLTKLASTLSVEQRILLMEAVKIAGEMDAAEQPPPTGPKADQAPGV